MTVYIKNMLASLLLTLNTLNFAKAISCIGLARYTLTFQGEWTSARHPDFPSNPHFSAVVGCSHKASYVMWKAGIKARTGVKDVAERGRTFAINSEMDGQISAKNAHKRNQGRVIFGGRASDRITNIEVTSEYPLVSFITMIAPSPDWFIGVHDYSLCNTTTGKWKNEISRDLFPYDAGTDSGQFFTSSDSPTNPPENIHLLTNDIDGSLKSNQPVKSFGTFTFVKTSEVNVPIASTSVSTSSSTAQRTKNSISLHSSTIEGSHANQAIGISTSIFPSEISVTIHSTSSAYMTENSLSLQNNTTERTREVQAIDTSTSIFPTEINVIIHSASKVYMTENSKSLRNNTTERTREVQAIDTSTSIFPTEINVTIHSTSKVYMTENSISLRNNTTERTREVQAIDTSTSILTSEINVTIHSTSTAYMTENSVSLRINTTEESHACHAIGVKLLLFFQLAIIFMTIDS